MIFAKKYRGLPHIFAQIYYKDAFAREYFCLQSTAVKKLTKHTNLYIINMNALAQHGLRANAQRRKP